MRKQAWIALGAALVIIVGVVILIVSTLSSPISSGNNATATPGEQVQVSRTISGKTAAEDKADVLQAAEDLLSAADGPQGEADFSALMGKIDSGEVTMPDELKSKIRLVDNLASEDGIDKTIYQALVSFSSFAKQSSGSNEITPRYDNAAEGITLDQEAGIAYVPTTLFVSSASGVNGFSMEFVYIDGKWVFSPYMTLDELRLALVLQGSTTTPAQ